MNIQEVNAIEICPHEGIIRLIKITEKPKDTCVLDYQHEVFAEFEYGDVVEKAYEVDTFGFTRYDVRFSEVEE